MFAFVESLPSIPTPDTLASPLCRARKLAQLLCDDVSGSALVADAGEQLTKALNSELDGQAAKYADKVAAGVADLETTDVGTDVLDGQGRSVQRSTRQIATHLVNLDRDTRKVIGSVPEGAGKDYYRYRVDKAGDDVDTLSVRTEVAAVFSVNGVREALDAAATEWVQDHLSDHAVAIKNTTGSTRDSYRRVQEMTRAPEAATIDLRDNLTTATSGSTGPLPVFAKHLFSDSKGMFPARLNSWETEVIGTEIARSTTVAWYRNPSRATPAALRIAYQRDDDRWTSLQPDFVVISRLDDGALAASIVDPHGAHLADARNKLTALADFAEQHGGSFVRVESITKIGDGLRYLDLGENAVRDEVRSFDGAEVAALYSSEVSAPYVTG